MGSYAALGQRIGQLVDEKQAAYGDSMSAAPRILEVLYPDGVRPDQYADLLAVVRVLDKLKRIATANDPFGESPWQDIAGYGLLMADDTE